MKVFIEKNSGRISLPEDFAVLEKINEDGSFLYRFKYNANIPKIFRGGRQRRAIKVNINVVKNVPMQSTVRLFDRGFNSTEIIRRLRFQNSLQRQLNRRKRKLRLKQKCSDITKRIPTSETGRIQRHTAGATLGLSRRFVNSIRSVSSLEAGNTVAPVLELNLNKDLPIQEIQATSRRIRLESLRLLFLNRQDPASWIGRRTRTIVPARKQHRGITGKGSFFTRHHNDPVLRNRIDTLIKSYLTKTNAANHEDLPGAQFINVMTISEDDIARIEETMTLEATLLTDDTFVVEFNLINQRGLLVQQITSVVKHGRNVSLLRRPVEAPFMSIASLGRKGRNFIELKQLDENATKIALYRKEIKASQFNLTDDFENIQVVDVTTADGTIFTEDITISNNPVIYRAIPVGIDGNLGAEFTSVVVQGEHIKTGLKENFRRRPCFLTLYNEIQDRTNVLFVDNIPNEPISLEVHRRSPELKDSFQLIDTIYLEAEPNRPVEVNDDGLTDGRIYEYKCKLLYADGAKVDAGNTLIMKYTPLESNVVNVDIQNLAYDRDEDIIDVSFDIVKTAISKELDTVKAALSLQEITEYDDDIKEKKEKLQDLFFVRVTRTNLITGEVEDFGIVEDVTFSDRKLGPVQNIAELENGTSYKYAVIIHARPTETLIPGFTRTVNSGSVDQYELTPSKFLHPITLSTHGSIVSEQSLLRNHAESAFTVGKIVEIKYVDVALGNFLPKIEKAKAEKINSTRTLLKWNVKGDLTLIDHFLVALEINSMRTIVGKSHAVGGSNSFEFVDVLDNGEHGALEYLITPVYYDYSRGAELRLKAIFI